MGEDSNLWYSLSLIFFAHLRSNLRNSRVGRAVRDQPAIWPVSSWETATPRREGTFCPRSHRELGVGLGLQPSSPDPKSGIPSHLCRSLPQDASSHCFASEQHYPMRRHTLVSTEKEWPGPGYDQHPWGWASSWQGWTGLAA